MNDNAIAALAIVCIFGLPVVAWIVFRALRFIERLEMIKRGIVPPPEGFGAGRAWREWSRQQQPQGGRWSGAPWQQGPPPGPVPGPPPQAPWASYDDDAQRALHKGIRLSLIGLAILIGLSFIGGTPGSSDFHPGPWLLGGLIPMFVGIAQIIIAVLSGAQLPGVQPRTTVIPPPPPGTGAPPPGGFGTAAPPPPGAQPWQQPGRPHFEELSKPVQPPDVR